MNIENAVRTLDSAKEITFFTGAGLSAESGIGTFRGENGLWDEFGKHFSTWNDLIQSIAFKKNIFG
jgi:NAD-dependent SIR2 family protein deacetylase